MIATPYQLSVATVAIDCTRVCSNWLCRLWTDCATVAADGAECVAEVATDRLFFYRLRHRLSLQLLQTVATDCSCMLQTATHTASVCSNRLQPILQPTLQLSVATDCSCALQPVSQLPQSVPTDSSVCSNRLQPTLQTTLQLWVATAYSCVLQPVSVATDSVRVCVQ